MFYYLIKENVYIYFATYLTSQTLLQLAVSGFAAIYLWPDFPFWIDRSVPILMSITLITGLSFVIEFIQKSKFKQWQINIIRVYQTIALLIIISCFFDGKVYNAGVWLLYRLIPPFYFGLIVLAVYFFAKLKSWCDRTKQRQRWIGIRVKFRFYVDIHSNYLPVRLIQPTWRHYQPEQRRAVSIFVSAAACQYLRNSQ